ncbi:hypothetical protein MLD38_036378 [Melastoma candidum]|uniref:Uncharacterized protein n=1 Tax=Melastoma candidum TaxID=119954 RepID=A0ACB9LJG9_9MYRT|nr:hypothetical protein MLD38_036378 [Melastoma candidum]
METKGGQIDLDQLFSYCDDLVSVLRDDKDVAGLSDLRGSDSLRASSLAGLDRLSSSIQDLQRKIESCEEKTEVARAEVVADSAIDMLPKELDEVLRNEKMPIEESRVIANEIKDLDQQRASIEDQERALKRLEKQELREQMMLSMYASVTTVIPNLTDDSNVSGYIVDRKKNVVERFQFDPASPDACESIWRMIDEQEDRVKSVSAGL